MIVNRFDKRFFSLFCHKIITVKEVTNLYYTHIWHVYRTSEIATSDYKSQFISTFINKLCKLIRVKQKLLIVYHLQIDNNTEILNQYINQRLRLFINHFQDN